MDIFKINDYLYAASKALSDDSEYQHWVLALGNARKEAEEKCGCYTEKVEGCLWQLYVRQLAYILDNREKIESDIRNDGIPNNDADEL